MSAWRVGAESAGTAPLARGRRAERGLPSGALEGEPTGGSTGLQSFVDRVTKWIPGEVITLYVAGITLIAASQDVPEPEVWWLIVAAVLAGVITVTGAFAASGGVPTKTWVAAGLAVVAFLIWSMTVPASGWQKIDFVRDNPGKVALIAGIAGLIFSQIAEGIEKASGNN